MLAFCAAAAVLSQQFHQAQSKPANSTEAAELEPFKAESYGGECPGRVDVLGYGGAALVPVRQQVVPGQRGMVHIQPGQKVVPSMGGWAMFADKCDSSTFLRLDLLGKTLEYTTNMAGVRCGCNAAFWLAAVEPEMRHNHSLAPTIDMQEANSRAWHSTLHSWNDHAGVFAGYGGGGSDWNGPRDWTAEQYGPGGKCIDTRNPIQVAVSFPVNSSGTLTAVNVALSQIGSGCNLSVSIDDYYGMSELSAALAKGMTPMVSYWSNYDMSWLDGQGEDLKGPCTSEDTADGCKDVAAQFWGFAVHDIAGTTSTTTTSATSRTTSTTPAALHTTVYKSSQMGGGVIHIHDDSDFHELRHQQVLQQFPGWARPTASRVLEWADDDSTGGNKFLTIGITAGSVFSIVAALMCIAFANRSRGAREAREKEVVANSNEEVQQLLRTTVLQTSPRSLMPAAGDF